MFAPNLQSVRLLQSAAHRLSGIKDDFESLIDLAGDAVFVLLGEASHGTHEFYSTRTEIVFRCGCGATGMSKRSSGGYATTMMAGRRIRHRSDFMGSISIA